MPWDNKTLATLKAMGGGSGGGSSAPSDWNASEGEAGYIKNRTHYEEVKQAFEPIVWDESTPALDTQISETIGTTYIKVSNELLPNATGEGIASATLHAEHPTNGTMDIPLLFSVEGGNWTLSMGQPSVPIVVAISEDSGAMTKGTWIIDGVTMGMRNWSITITPTVVTTIKTLDPKYLPESHQFGEESETIEITWDGDKTGKETVDASDLFGTEGYFVKLSDKSPDMGSVVGNSIFANTGEDLSGELLALTGCYAIGTELVVVVTDFATSSLMDVISFPSNGIWCVLSGGTYASSINIETEVVKPLDPKYLPMTDIITAVTEALPVAEEASF